MATVKKIRLNKERTIPLPTNNISSKNKTQEARYVIHGTAKNVIKSTQTQHTSKISYPELKQSHASTNASFNPKTMNARRSRASLKPETASFKPAIIFKSGPPAWG